METRWRRKCSQRTRCAESSLRPMAPLRMVSASLQQGTSSSLRATTTPLRYLSLLYSHFSLSSLFCSLCTIDSFLIPNTSCRVRTGAIALAKSEMCLCIQEQNQRNQIINLTKIKYNKNITKIEQKLNKILILIDIIFSHTLIKTRQPWRRWCSRCWKGRGS